MNLKNTYFGFTNNKKPMQAAKIENTLDKLWRFDGEIMSMKEYIYIRLQEGSKPDFEENYSYYSRRLDDYTKPKTLYKIQHDDNSYTEVTKTAYLYALHLINNDLLNEEKAQSFINNEKAEKEEQERLEQERIQKEREEVEAKRQKEDQERKENLARKRKEWHEIGKQFLNSVDNNPITEVLDIHWKEIKNIYVDEEKENFYSNMIKRFTEMLGNKDYCIHWLQYYIENENDQDEFKMVYTLKNNPIRKIEKDILFKAFSSVSLNDKKQTITAKVKAIYNGREYKGSTKRNGQNEEVFYILNRNKEHEAVTGKRLTIEGLQCFMHKGSYSKYILSEITTGVQVTSGDTQKEVKDKVKEAINKKGIEYFNKTIETIKNKYGISPYFRDKETA